MEPVLVTDPQLVEIRDELINLERHFHHPEQGAACSVFEDLTEPNFWEIGASGRKYSREIVLRVLNERSATPPKVVWQTSDSYCLEIAPNNYLLTYTLTQDTRITLRSTIWRKHVDTWKIVFHQGTVVQNNQA
jgi:hypothetical protein